LEFSRSLTFMPARSFDTVQRLTNLFYRVRYGESELDGGQRRRLGRVIGQVESELEVLRPAPDGAMSGAMSPA
jgi:hypothetical protein